MDNYNYNAQFNENNYNMQVNVKKENFFEKNFRKISFAMLIATVVVGVLYFLSTIIYNVIFDTFYWSDTIFIISYYFGVVLSIVPNILFILMINAKNINPALMLIPAILQFVLTCGSLIMTMVNGDAVSFSYILSCIPMVLSIIYPIICVVLKMTNNCNENIRKPFTLIGLILAAVYLLYALISGLVSMIQYISWWGLLDSLSLTAVGFLANIIYIVHVFDGILVLYTPEYKRNVQNYNMYQNNNQYPPVNQPYNVPNGQNMYPDYSAPAQPMNYQPENEQTVYGGYSQDNDQTVYGGYSQDNDQTVYGGYSQNSDQTILGDFYDQ